LLSAFCTSSVIWPMCSIIAIRIDDEVFKILLTSLLAYAGVDNP
jgi:hypothetical protein